MTKPSQNPTPVDSALYDQAYYLGDCNGHVEFNEGVMPVRLLEAIQQVVLTPGMYVLDVGCGRGEVIRAASQVGAWVWGIDYAAVAVAIAARYLSTNQLNGSSAVGQANARQLPYPDASFDLVVMLDIVEHLYPYELQEALHEAYRVLRPDGILLVHTGPNLWYYRFGYPLYWMFRRLQGHVLPSNPKDRYPTHNVLHVNEQSPNSLKQVLHKVGFRSRVWVDQLHNPLTQGDGPLIQALVGFVTTNIALKWVFCGDIFAVCRK